MKATVDIPDALYRQVKSKSALENRTIREVTVALYRNWIEATSQPEEHVVKETATPYWFGGAKRYADQVEDHDMESIRDSIARGRQP